MRAVVVLAVVCAAAVLWVPARRPAGPRGTSGRGTRSVRTPRRRPGGTGASGDLSATLHAVAAQLRAGADPATAWQRVLGASTQAGPGTGGVPVPSRWVVPGARAGAATGDPARVPAGVTAPAATVSALGRGRGASQGARSRTAAVVAATALAHELGAPLAGVLERLAAAVGADEEAEGEVRAAVAGPRATARVLTWLPVLGALVGVGMGADPVETLLGGGAGSAAGVAGVVLLLVGRWWTRRLLARAAASGGMV